MTDLIHQFTEPLLQWFDRHGRKNLPWQSPKNAYRVWVSEIMLQQTQVQTVIPYFERFIKRFPEIDELACVEVDEVLAYWSGLGYYSRARNLHQTARIVVQQFSGCFPANVEELINFPGIGLSTAAAITSLAFNQPTAILDGNVKRVLSRYFMVEGRPEQSQVKNKLWQLANQCMAQERASDYTQAIMDFGAQCCTNKQPTCSVCPLQASCLAYKNLQVANYPFKKVKKSLPTHQQLFLLCFNDEQQVYLEKRPPVGLWGGLWCMPIVDLSCDITNFIYQEYGLHCQNIVNLAEIKHTFSHFHLQIKAQAIQVQPALTCLKESKGKWFNEADFSKLGLAKPITKLLQLFFSSPIGSV